MFVMGGADCHQWPGRVEEERELGGERRGCVCVCVCV